MSRLAGRAAGGHLEMNLTPMIDVVFILITFFMVIFRSIGRENFRIEVPDQVAGAVESGRAAEMTVSVFLDEGVTRYAVDGKVLGGAGELVGEIGAGVGGGEVELRADGDLTWGEVSAAMLALSEARVGTVRLSAVAGEGDGL